MKPVKGASLVDLAASATAASLADLCTVANVRSALPTDGTLLGIDLLPSSVTANVVYNATTGGVCMVDATASGSTETYTYCNNDEVILKLAFPSPSDINNRFYNAGGGGSSLSSDATGGLEYAAAAGATSAGYDGVVLAGSGFVNWNAIYMLGYQALGEMIRVGKYLTKGFYGLSNGTKIYTYYEECSDGGLEGMSQIQRWGEKYDGAITGAPALHYAQ